MFLLLNGVSDGHGPAIKGIFVKRSSALRMLALPAVAALAALAVSGPARGRADCPSPGP